MGKNIDDFLEEVEKEVMTPKITAKPDVVNKNDTEYWAKYNGSDRIISSDEAHVIAKEKRKHIKPIEVGIVKMDDILNGVVAGELIVVTGITSHGKCHGKGTKILMFDGTIKNVENVVCGDFLMGDNSIPRKVLNVATGKEMLYTVKQLHGDDYVVNESHILSLKRTRTNIYRDDNPKREKRLRKNRKGEIKDISVIDYLNSSNGFKHFYKGYKVGIKFSARPILIEPYLLGVWLGDGNSNAPQITTADKEIVGYLVEFASKNNFAITKKEQPNNKSNKYYLKEKTRNNKNRLKDFLRNYNLLYNKHIPFNYKTNSRKVRLQLLAGVIDTDGTINNGNCYTITTKRKKLAEDIAYVGRSLGFYCSITEIKKGIRSINFTGEYYNISISGNIFNIPIKIKRKVLKRFVPKRDVLVTGVEVEKIGVGEYYGFAIDGNRRYLLGDFTVTHNTLFAQSITHNIANNNVSVLWFSFEVSMLQLLDKFEKMGCGEKVLFYVPAENEPNSVSWIENKIKEAKAKLYDTKVIFIDHLDYVVPHMTGANRADVIGEAMRMLKTLAIKYDCVIFLLAHVGKISEDKKPAISSIRSSSYIGQESDDILYVERVYNKETKFDDARVSILKNRREGPIGKFYMEYVNYRLQYKITYEGDERSRYDME